MAQDFADRMYAPVERQNPKMFLQVEGERDPSLQLEIRMFYETTNESCRRAVSWVEGAYSARVIRLDIPVKVSGDHYSAIIPVDKFEPGYCGWVPSSGGYAVTKAGFSKQSLAAIPNPFFWYSSVKGGVNLPRQEIVCQETTLLGKPELWCANNGAGWLSVHAKKVQVDFRERPFLKLPIK